MTPLEALNLMYQAAGMAWLTRMEHVQIDQAAQTLQGILDKREPQPDIKSGPVAVENKE